MMLGHALQKEVYMTKTLAHPSLLLLIVMAWLLALANLSGQPANPPAAGAAGGSNVTSPAPNVIIIGRPNPNPPVVQPNGLDQLRRGGIAAPLTNGFARPLTGGFGTPLTNGFGRPLSNGFARPLSNGFGMPLSNGFGRPLSNGFAAPMTNGSFPPARR